MTAGEELTQTHQELIDEASRMCTCLHRLHEHTASPVGCMWRGGEQECSCSMFRRRHSETLREHCWCYNSNLAPEHPSEVENVQPRYIQMALDSVRTQLDLLTLQLVDWGNTEDLNARVENWLFNTKRTMDEILKTG